MTYAVEAHELRKTYGETVALDSVSFAAKEGKVLGVLGPNGAGKTTAVRILATLARPDSGSATILGHDVVKEAGTVRKLVGLTGQYASVDEDMTGVENLMLFNRLLGFSRRESKKRTTDSLERFSLTDAGKRLAKTYSGGMRRRLDLAASLLGSPKILYLDEPTTGLDPHHRNEVWHEIRGLVADGVTVLLTTQYLEEADQLADDLVVIDRGNVIASGTPDSLKDDLATQTLEVRPEHDSDFEAVASVVTDLAGREPLRDPDRNILSVRVDDVSALPELVRRLDMRDISTAELALRRPSLDEVFLELTGHTARSEGHSDEGGGA